MNWLTSRCAPLLALTTLALTSCDKGTDLNVDLPDTTAISTEYRDLPLDVATVRLTPVQTLKADYFLIGRLADNVAGTTEARAYFNVITNAAADSLPSKFTQPVLDSVVLVLGFDKVYGSATTPAQFNVFKLRAPLDERQTYNASSQVDVDEPLGQNVTSRLNRTQPATTTTPAVPDQTVRLLLQRRAFPPVGDQPAIPAIPLQFATDLFDQLSRPGFGQAQLDGLLKGLAIAPSASHSSSIVSFTRAAPQRMVVYFHGNDLKQRTYSIFFGAVYSGGLGLPAARDPRYFTRITNALPPALAALANQSGAVSASALGGTSYAQEGTGLGTRVTFTGLTELINASGLTINRAELRIPVKPFSNALFPNPAALYAVEVGASNNVLQRIINFASYDRVVQADGYPVLGPLPTVGERPATGTLVDASTTQPYYSIPITNYLQAYLTGALDGNPAALVLTPNIRSSSALSLNRAALDANRISLRVYYSKR
ncbi:DUF4270 family protein [Hymenobacter sp. BT664]|uniref:DUF4270 family protein n=1 Tax=Hymenobacter montanus TaxID=2771359 RepID=A0A927BFW2_9BACT|nr:DUF4270 family protein [Hymenobacter montanus]MBD2769262.1 DUF4270 family protein [Hymenobacter montanus]